MLAILHHVHHAAAWVGPSIVFGLMTLMVGVPVLVLPYRIHTTGLRPGCTCKCSTCRKETNA